ncbi:hypothetical protein PROFUN_16104 [Planoprotostelium fungivorum]|uniref:Uncharacterized protein n=1 Tax=Planoprotostelium fungivorum TaxID=1890364 RepID=A0A2P6MRK6_9EUKA|nr:hypothetical protein PROFUN_16104 [Planoprotostelium fungivorum]
MWVRKGLTPWSHGVPTVMTRGACQILGRVAGQFSHFFQSKVRITLNISPSILQYFFYDKMEAEYKRWRFTVSFKPYVA